MPARRLAALGCVLLTVAGLVAGCGGGASTPTRTAVLDESAATTETGAGTTSTEGVQTTSVTVTTPTATASTVVHQTQEFTPIPVSATGTVRVPILMYHRVADPAPIKSEGERRLNVSPQDFAKQMDWLAANGYRTITQSQLYDALATGAALPKRPVLLTFDDGYIDISKTVLPILRKRKMVATAYVITDRVTGSDRAFMKFKALRRIEAGGIEVGSHTVSHSDLTSLSESGLRNELAGSRRVLEKGLGHPVQWLCYPAGRFDSRVEAMARETGYVTAVTTEPGVSHSASRPYALSRVRISDSTGVSGLRAALAG